MGQEDEAGGQVSPERGQDWGLIARSLLRIRSGGSRATAYMLRWVSGYILLYVYPQVGQRHRVINFTEHKATHIVFGWKFHEFGRNSKCKTLLPGLS